MHKTKCPHLLDKIHLATMQPAGWKNYNISGWPVGLMVDSRHKNPDRSWCDLPLSFPDLDPI